ncbi:hypothetical protein HPP92_023534 [Vanilla planifolia]|uniref:Uncharacterized protein n=1 Tax=Vanilla planifolia TaxID=51239 RepID=A0A835UE87_VANPL|nr:hypothetical protein HPP92_023534 [Vanilla planifolia]
MEIEDRTAKVELSEDRMINQETKENHGEDCQLEESRKLSKLLTQLESLEKAMRSDCSTKCSCRARSHGAKETNIEGITKELRSVKKQNRITHCLLAVMIVVTAAWQMSEVSLLLAAKDKLCHPLRAVGYAFKNAIKRRMKKLELEGASLTPIGVPPVTGMDLPSLAPNYGEQ